MGEGDWFAGGSGNDFYGEEDYDEIVFNFGGTFVQDGDCPVAEIPGSWSLS